MASRQETFPEKLANYRPLFCIADQPSDLFCCPGTIFENLLWSRDRPRYFKIRKGFLKKSI